MLNKLKDTKSNISKEEVYTFLLAYLKEQLELSRRESTNEDSFSKPAWSEFQAYQLGLQKAYLKLLNIIPDKGI